MKEVGRLRRRSITKPIDTRGATLWCLLMCSMSMPACFRAMIAPPGSHDGSTDSGSADQGPGSTDQAFPDDATTTDARSSEAGDANRTDSSSTDTGGTTPSTCRTDAECQSGHCVDGVCCDSACDGQCESCKQTGSVGTCKPVTGDPVSPREACGGTGMCRGQCDGTDGKTCTFPDGATVCTAATCTSGKVNTASVCNGAGACAPSVSATCSNNQCAAGGAECATTCTASSCGPGFYCDATGACLEALANGKSCSSGGMCTSGYCVDGLCCDGKCDGQCESCKEASAPGKCTPVKGAPLATHVPCGGAASCKGQCDGADGKACAFPDSSVVCVAASCTGGKATSASVCNGSGACTTATTSPCMSNLCATDGSGKCSGSCTVTSCASGTYCDSTGTCAPTLGGGASCSSGTQCTSGFCTDGVCCDGKCDGQCQSCRESGSVGKCQTIKGDPISPRPACGGTGKCKAQCGGTDAVACSYPDSATVCTPAKCTAGKVTTATVCNGSGSCTTSTMNACDSNLCAADGIMCAGSCTATSCAAGTYCGSGGACAPTIADGKTCSADNQCTHGHCVSGICCATTCGTCHSCSTGTCNLVTVATSCMAGSAAGVCDATGTCNACTSGASCTDGVNAECQTGATDCSTGKPVCKATNKPATTKCGSGPSCTSGKFTDQGTCSSGSCMTPAPMNCQSGACNGTQCLSCSSAPGASTAATGATGPSGVLCSGTQATLKVTGGSLGSGASWVWYSNVTHSTRVGTGAQITVPVTTTTTYYVRAEGACNTTSDASVTVTIRPPPQFATNPQSYASPCNSVDWVSFSVTPTSGTMVKSYQWGTAVYTDPTAINTSRYYTGAQTATLMVAPQNSTDVWCTITDVCDVTVKSGSAHLAVPDQSTCQ